MIDRDHDEAMALIVRRILMIEGIWTMRSDATAMVMLFDCTGANINMHLKAMFERREVEKAPAIKYLRESLDESMFSKYVLWDAVEWLFL